jgi:hypothetical protein
MGEIPQEMPVRAGVFLYSYRMLVKVLNQFVSAAVCSGLHERNCWDRILL